MLQRLTKFRLSALPVGLAIAAVMLVCSEIFSIPLLVPLSFLPIIVGLVYLAPLLAIGFGWCYEKIFGGGIQGTLISASLRYRSTSIGMSVVLLFCICTVSTVTVGLANAGLGQVSSGMSYWKPGIHWGALPDDDNLEDIFGEFLEPGVMGTFGQGRLMSESHRSVNAFVMGCQEYSALATEDPQCPSSDSEVLMIPVGIDRANLSSELYIPGTETVVQLPPLQTLEVPGLTEVLISTGDKNVNSVGRYLYADLERLPPSVVLSMVTHTRAGLTSQERIDDVNSAMSAGYYDAALALVVSILLFGLAAVSGISIAAIRDRRNLFNALLIRGVDPAAAKRLVRIETISLTIPFAILGCLSGTVLAAAIAKVSSLEPSDAITNQALWIMITFICAVPVITEVLLHRAGDLYD